MKKLSLSYSCLIFASLLALGSVTAPAKAQSMAGPSLINFQGRLAKPDGTPVADGTYSVRFSLHNALSGGSEKWNQTVGTVNVKNGTFAVLLNLTSGFTAGNDLRTTLNGNTYLEIKIGTDAPLIPRQHMVSMAYALRANSVADGSITESSFASGSLSNLSWLLAGNSISNPATQFLGTTSNQPLVFRTNNTEKMRLNANGYLGIGVTNPATILTVQTGPEDYGLSHTDGTRLLSTFIGPFGGSDGGWLGTVSNHPLLFYTNNSGAQMVLSTSGNLGIGTQAPIQTLDVRGNLGVGTANLPIGLSHEVGGNTPLLNLDANFRFSNKNNTYRGGALRIDTRNGAPLFQFLTRAAGSATENIPVVITETGRLGIGTGAPASALHVVGTTTTNVLTIIGGSDIAEPFDVASDRKVLPGMVVSIDEKQIGKLRLTSTAYDHTVAGIISGANGVNPGVTLTQTGTVADGKFPVAMSGRVWCYVDADANGAIKAGDLLTTSATPGHAMKATDHAQSHGAIIGKAMSALAKGKGLVLVLVNLH